MNDTQAMLRVPRVAKLLDVSRKRVYQLIQEGRLEAVRLGPRQTRILRDSLDAYIEELRRRERIARGDEIPDPAESRRARPRHRVSRARRPPEFNPLAVETFFGETRDGRNSRS